MKIKKMYLRTFFLLVIASASLTNATGQTLTKTFSFEFSRESLPVKKDQNGWDYIQPDSSLYNFSLESDTLKPELPSINYKILLPDNYRVKKIRVSVEDVITFGGYNITLRPNSSRTTILTANSDDKVVTYPLTYYRMKATCVSEEITNGYRVANLSINPFEYYAEDKGLILNTNLDIEVTIEPVDEDEELYPQKDSESIKEIVYNPEDVDAGTDNWTKIENPSTQCTVGNISINGWDKIEHRYTKDWNIRFAAPQTLMEKVQVGILVNKDSIHNGTKYQVIERKKNGYVTDSLLYRQEGNRVYHYSETEMKDILLFDFGLNEGDDFIAPDGEVWTVDEIKETAEYNDWMEKKMVLKGKEDGAVKDVWLEHVGSLYTGILTYDDLGGSSSLPQLVYCRQGDTTPWLFDVNTEHFKIVYFYRLDDIEEYNFIQSLSPEEAAYFDQHGEDDKLYANFEGNTLHIYGKMGMNCYRYPMECRITDNEILLKVDEIHYGEQFDCVSGSYVDIRIPNVKAGGYTIKYAPMFSEYSGKEQILKASPSTIDRIPKVNFFVNGSTLTFTYPNAVKVEVYTLDAVKVGEARFTNGEVTMTVDKIPATYLYIVTYPDGRRESGKVMVK